MTTSHITAAEVRHQKKRRRERERVRDREREREREREITREQEREGKTQPTEREREIEKFSMMDFDSATSSFPALLVNKSFRKESKKAKLKTIVFNFTVKKT